MVNFGAASGASRSNEGDRELSLGVNNLRGVRLCWRRGAACKVDFRFVPTPILVADFGPGDGGFEPKMVLTGLGDRIERLRVLWACLTGVLNGWEDGVKKDVKESDAADERKIEPSSSSTAIGCGIFGACACAVDLQGDCNGL